MSWEKQTREWEGRRKKREREGSEMGDGKGGKVWRARPNGGPGRREAAVRCHPSKKRELLFKVKQDEEEEDS